MNDGIDITIVLVALVIAFLLSGMEAGVFALSRFRIRRLARQGDHRAARLQRYLEQPENFLWTILVGQTLAVFSIVAFCTLELQERTLHRPAVFTGAVFAGLFLLYLFADLLPKLIFRRFPNRLTLLGVGPFRVLHLLLTPVVGATEWVSRAVLRVTGGQAFTGRLFGTRAELRHVIEDSAQSLSREEVVMINRILDLQKLRVRDVMTPIERAATLNAAGTVGDLLALGRKRRVSYVPIWREQGGRRRVHGVVALADALHNPGVRPEDRLTSLVQPALFADEQMRLEDALRAMQRGRQRLAVVLDPYRRETGVITLTDILRAMFGEVGV